MNIQSEIKKIIEKALQELDIKVGKIHLEHPVDLSMGDYSTNVAMVWAKKVKQNPKELAEKIVEKINFVDVRRLQKVEVAGPGFINFYLSSKFFEESISEILKAGDKYGDNENLKGQKVMVEYTDPNPFKELHIGHLVPNAIGESVSRIIEKNGAEVRRVTFQGDVGMHVAKAIWGLGKLGVTTDSGFTAKDLGKAYAEGSKFFEENEEIKEEIKELNKKIYEMHEGVNVDFKKLYEKGKDISLKYFEEVYKVLGSNFDNYFFESETGLIGEKIVKENIGKVFKKSQDAVIFEGEEYGLHTRVFINAQGLPTYETKDVGLIIAKQEWWLHDTSITITGGEQETYFKVVMKAVELALPKLAGTMKLIANGMLKLSNGKMSSRTGDVIRAVDLIDDIKNKVEEKVKDVDKKTIQDVAVGAIKYSILKSTSGKDIIFDFEKSISFEGNSGPYLQYTYARAKSILEKAKVESIKKWVSDTHQNNEILEIEKLLYRFPEVVERAGEEYQPHYIATYLFELAQAFNSYYGNNKIVDKNDENSPFKVALSEAVAHTIRNGLYLLGIEAPNRL